MFRTMTCQSKLIEQHGLVGIGRSVVKVSCCTMYCWYDKDDGLLGIFSLRSPRGRAKVFAFIGMAFIKMKM